MAIVAQCNFVCKDECGLGNVSIPRYDNTPRVQVRQSIQNPSKLEVR